MADRDNWFAVHASGDGSLTKHGGPTPVGGGFRIDPAAAPAVRTAFEKAVGEMHEARESMRAMQYMAGRAVNPVVDKYVAALAEVGYGAQGSVVMAVDSAVAEYQSVIGQLSRIIESYGLTEDEAARNFTRLES